MIKAKVLALCVCPVLAAPPAVLAIHRPARHAAAHLLHRVARRLDHDTAPAVAVAATPVVAALPCAPSLAGGGGLPVVGGDLIGGGIPAGSAAAALAAADGPGYGDSGNSGGFGGGFGGGGGGGGGGAGSPGPSGGGGPMPISTIPPGVIGPGMTPPPIATSAQVSGAPEPAAWLFLVIGFGLVGAIARTTRIGRTTAAAGGG